MAAHVTHAGVHDHGFNNVSTYGNLLRLMNEGRIPEDAWERAFYELALKSSGAVQARRWTRIAGGGGFIYSFNGPHSLFVDTIRSLRSLALAHSLGHVLMEENDRRVSLLERLLLHARATARYSVYYGEGRDRYDVRGRVAHESIFNVNDGSYRCPNTQQGYSPFSTWTRGLTWAMLGFAEQLEFLESLPAWEPEAAGSREETRSLFLRALEATCDYYLENTAADGIPYWDTGAPGLDRLGDWREAPADPFNAHEPVDSSAAAIACQGLMRYGAYLDARGDARASRYLGAGLAVLARLLEEPYLSVGERHQGLLLHSVYHRPNGWDHVPPGRAVPCGESSMWGDYHLREAGVVRAAPGRRRAVPGVLAGKGGDMTIADLSQIAGRTYPARRRTQNLVGGASPIQARNFCMGYVTLEPGGGQVPWHNQEQEEVYFVVRGTGEICLGEERATLGAGQAAYIPPGVFHQLTNIGEEPLVMIYVYGPAGDVAHWRQELEGTLPRAGSGAPPLPAGARPQRTEA